MAENDIGRSKEKEVESKMDKYGRKCGWRHR
jgi:hypothetical protein